MFYIKSFTLRDWIVTALLSALVYVFTSFIHFTLPISINGGGLVHFGNVMAVICALVFGKTKGALAGAVGMGMFDLLSGYAVWAPFTIVIRGVMGYEMGYLSHKRDNGNNLAMNIFAVFISGFIMIGGYYIAQVILYGDFVAPVASIPGDIINSIFALVIGVPAATLIRRHPAMRSWVNNA